MELASTVPKAPASNEEATMMNEEETIGFSTLASFDNPDSIEQRKVSALDPFEPGWLNGVGGSFDFECPKGQAITQIRSTYTHKLLHRDRKWSFKCEPTFRLEASAGVEESSRETFQSESNGNIDFECKKGVLVGVASQKPGKRYYRTFTFHCLYVRPRNIIAWHHEMKIKVKMNIPKYEESSVSAMGPISGISATASEWSVMTTRLRGSNCQPGFKGEFCSETCQNYPCEYEETKSSFGKSFAFFCPKNQIVHKIAMDVDAEGKTRWAIKCRYSPLLNKDVTCKTIRNDYHTKDYKCPDGGVLTGLQYWAEYGQNTFAVSCCAGKPKSAEKCRVNEVVQGKPFNPSGGSFTYQLDNKYVGITALEVKKNDDGRQVWTPSFADIACTCSKTDTEHNFLVHEPSGLVLGQTWNEKRKTFRATLQLQSGNNSQLWTEANGKLTNSQGLALDSTPDGLIVVQEQKDANSQRWSFKEGRIMNEKLGIYLSLFGVARDGMNLFHINKPVTMDKSWQLQKMDQEYLCLESCWKKPCKNGGTCVKSSVTGYECNCPAGFQGRNCEENVDECLPSLCQHGSICVDGVNDYKCRCSPEFTGKDCGIPKDHEGKLEDMRCVDLVAHLKITMKEKISICNLIRDGIDQGLKLRTIFDNLIELGHRLESPLNVLKMIAASSKLRARYENYPLRCIREGAIKAFPELQRLMKEANIKAIPESVQSVIKMAVQFYKSPLDGDRGIMQLLKLKSELCGDDACSKEDILSIIATAVLPEADEYDGFKLASFRRKPDFC